MLVGGIPFSYILFFRSRSDFSNHISLLAEVSLSIMVLVVLSRWFICCEIYSPCIPLLSRDLPGQYCIRRFAIVGPGFRVLGVFMMHWPGSRRADGLVRIKDRSSGLSGLISSEALE